LIAALVTLVVVLDPIGLAPAFVAITDDLAENTHRAVPLRACLIAITILAGDWLLRTLSTTLPTFRTAGGGLLLFSIA
jgi:multiple antibiotic resistance protein